MEVWSHVPQGDLIESLEWKTDVIRCRSEEQRSCLRLYPRTNLQFNHQMGEREFSLSKEFSRKNTISPVLVPLWPDYTPLGVLSLGSTTLSFDTTTSHYSVGGYVLVHDEYDQYEVRTVIDMGVDHLEVDALESNYLRASVVPLVESRFVAPLSASRGASDFVKSKVQFQVMNLLVTPESPYPEYMGHPVLTDRTVVVSSVNEEYQREWVEEDNQTGQVWVGDSYSYAISKTSIGWITLTREELWQVRSWLHLLKGKWKSFWVISWNSDFSLVDPIVSTDEELRVNFVGIETPRDLVIITKSGVLHYLRVTGSSPGLGGSEVLSLSSVTGFNLSLSQVEMISTLNLMRLDSDRVEIKHRAARGASISIPVVEVPRP